MKNIETAKRLQSALGRKGIKAQELATLSGVNKASISQYVNGTHSPSNLSAGKMAAILGVNPVWLMGFDVPMIDTPLAPSRSLSADESALLNNYGMLNETGKKKVREYAFDLTEQERYRKDGELSRGSAG